MKDITILFQGDSITDCGRVRISDSLGNGYVKKIKKYLDTFYSSYNITVLNRGVSGNRVCDLHNRWTKDCLDINPDILSIMIGINDTWCAFDADNPVSIEEFEEHYRAILTQATDNTDCKLIIMEPFIIPTDVEKQIYYTDLMPKILVIRKLAAEFGAIYLPLDGIFAREIAIKNNPEKYSEDGIHPTDKGHAVIAREWLKCFNL